MHMADALLSPATGLLMWAASGAVLGVAVRRLRNSDDDRLAPLMGLLGAFVFAVQMINFAIPLTGSSGHLGGAMLLAILLGPHAALIVIASVLSVQALFFADGGLLALGANLLNLGVIPCFVAYALVYRPLAGARPGVRRAAVAAVVACIVSAQLGALAVVLQTMASGISALPAGHFLALMLPIHLAIGLVEGLATAALLHFLRRARPELLAARVHASTDRLRPLLLGLGVVAALTGGVLSLFASSQPDGLEWSLARAGVAAEAPVPPGLHSQLHDLQQRIAWLPGYTLSEAAAPQPGGTPAAAPTLDPGTSLAGLVGGVLTLVLVLLVGLGLRRRRGRA
jgi:cobalt/nickel transport system permease protein